jgi:chitinase
MLPSPAIIRPFYSTPQQVESIDHAVRYLDSIGVPLSQDRHRPGLLCPGIQRASTAINSGLYRPCHFFRGVSYRTRPRGFLADSGWTYHWDPIAQAPGLYNAQKGSAGVL